MWTHNVNFYLPQWRVSRSFISFIQFIYTLPFSQMQTQSGLHHTWKLLRLLWFTRDSETFLKIYSFLCLGAYHHHQQVFCFSLILCISQTVAQAKVVSGASQAQELAELWFWGFLSGQAAQLLCNFGVIWLKNTHSSPPPPPKYPVGNNGRAAVLGQLLLLFSSASRMAGVPCSELDPMVQFSWSFRVGGLRYVLCKSAAPVGSPLKITVPFIWNMKTCLVWINYVLPEN